MPFATSRTRPVTQDNPRFQQPSHKAQARCRPTPVASTNRYTEEPSRVSYLYSGSEVQKTRHQDGTGTLFSDADKYRSASLAKLQLGKMTVDSSVRILEAEIGMLFHSRVNENTMSMLVALRETLQEDVTVLMHSVQAYKDVDPQCVTLTRMEIEGLRREAERWTNNIDVLEAWICKIHDSDAEQLDRLRRELYGAEYGEGVGLRKL